MKKLLPGIIHCIRVVKRRFGYWRFGCWRFGYRWIHLMGLFLIAFGISAQDNEIKITGNVTGNDVEGGMPGVTVQVKGTSNGVITDVDGSFTIYAGANDELVFSFVGYQKKVVPVNNQTRIVTELLLDLQQLNEVVVVGYGEQKKATLTGAITTIEAEELADLPAGNLSSSLVGKLAGVQVNRNGTGLPGTESSLVVRAESASGNIQRQVTYVIDGVIYTGEQDGTGPSGEEIFNRLDPSEIESISILKDAAAAVYGARAAGGVVVVKTKRGTWGKPKFNYSGSVGIGVPTQIPEMLSGYDHAVMLNDILDVRRSTSGGGRVPDHLYYTEEELELIKARDFDWLDGLYKAAETHRHTLNVSGGAQNIRYFVSGNYYYESGNYDNLWYRRFGLRSNIEADINDELLFSIGASFSEGTRKTPSYDPGSGNTGENVLRDWYKRPLTAPKWVKPTVDGFPVKFGSSWNPYGLLESNSHKLNESNNFNIIPKLTYEAPFLEGLKLTTQFSYNINSTTGMTYNQDYTVYETEIVGGASGDESRLLYEYNLTGKTSLIGNSEGLQESWSKGLNYQWSTSASYSNDFGRHYLNALIVYEQTDGRSKGLSFDQTAANVRGYPYVWAFRADGVTVSGDYDQIGRWGVIGRLNYHYNGKYLFESTVRGEASSKFAKEERFGLFPAVSIGWVLSDEGFFKGIGFIDFLKVRASTGLVGNDNTRPYEHQVAFIPEAEANGPIFGAGSGSLSNVVEPRRNGFTIPSRTWAKVNNNNIGADLQAIDNKLNLTLEWYYNRTYDGFENNNRYPFEIGNSKPPFENYRISFSTGFEVQLGWSDKLGNEFSYSIDANFSRRRSRPIRLYQNPAVEGTYVDDLLNDDSNQAGYIALGIIRTDEDLARVQAMYPDISGRPIQKGMIYYADIGGPNYSREPDGILDGNDRAIIAEYTSPPNSYGFSLGASWKGLRASAAFGGAFGHKEFIAKDEQETPTNSSNVFAWWGDYWTEENPNASMPRPYDFGLDGETSTFWMRDGHTLRLNFVQVSYQMPQVLINRIKLESWRVYFSANNVWTIISPFDYKDPSVSQGYDYPLVKTFNIGINFSL